MEYAKSQSGWPSAACFLSMWTPGTKGLAKTYFDFYLRNIWTLLVEEGKKYEKNFMKSVSSEIFGNKDCKC